MFTLIATALAVLAAAVLVRAAVKPDVFRVQRSARIEAPAEKIFPLINDFRRWYGWSPYEKLDPQMTRAFTGAAAGPGAVYTWNSQGKAGTGRMEIKEASPAKIAIALEFIKPFACQNVAEFTLQPSGEATSVTWSMEGPYPYVRRIFGTIFNLDAMVGKDFENGLESLKAIAEESA